MANGVFLQKFWPKIVFSHTLKIKHHTLKIILPNYPLSLDGTIESFLGSVGPRGDAAALCDDVTYLMSLLRSPLLIPRRRRRHIVIELLYAGSEYDGVLRYDSPFLCVFLTGRLLPKNGEETSKESRSRPYDLRCPVIEWNFASPWAAWKSTSRPKASHNRADFAVPWLRGSI